jgi:multidrug efflux pump subunit AcrA (membrane-fusion protein)
MRNFKIIFNVIISITLAVMAPLVLAEDEHGHKGHHNHKEDAPREHEEVEEHGHDEYGHKHGQEGPIELSKESQELAGIETVKVTRSSFAGRIPVSGRIAQDVENVKYVFPPEAATVEESYAVLGSVVKKDDVVCLIKLINNRQIVEVKAPISGTIISEFIKKGEHVDETTALYAIADLSKLWANFDVYEKDIASIKLGQKMIVYPLSYPDKSFEGKIVFISPRVDESTYTVKIRAEVENKNYLIKLGMSIKGEVLIGEDKSAITVPSEAVQTIENKTVVFKKIDEGKFEPQEVGIKSRTKESVVIGQGLKEGDEIVVKGSFILKSKMLEGEMGHDHSH